jgi:hypothetical protein
MLHHTSVSVALSSPPPGCPRSHGQSPSPFTSVGAPSCGVVLAHSAKGFEHCRATIGGVTRDDESDAATPSAVCQPRILLERDYHIRDLRHALRRSVKGAHYISSNRWRCVSVPFFVIRSVTVLRRRQDSTLWVTSSTYESTESDRRLFWQTTSHMMRTSRVSLSPMRARTHKACTWCLPLVIPNSQTSQDSLS